MPPRAPARWLPGPKPRKIHQTVFYTPHAAFLLALALVAATAFLLFPARRITILADGVERTVVSHQKSDAAIMRQAGLALLPGDRVLHQTSHDIKSLLFVRRAVPVMVEVNDTVYYWRTRADTVEATLAEIGVRSEEGDAVFVNDLRVVPAESLVQPPSMVSSSHSLGRLAPAALSSGQPLVISIRRAVPFTVIEDGHTLNFKSSDLDVATALRNNGITVASSDFLSPGPDTILSAGLSVRVDHANVLNVVLPETETVLYTHEATVAEAIGAAGIPLGELDRVEPSRDAPVVDGMEVQVYRVSTGKVVESEDIPFKTLAKEDEGLEWGEVRRVAGQEGVYSQEYEVVYEDGVEMSRVLTREWVEQEPVDAVVYFAGIDEETAKSLPEGLQVSRVMRVYATWYNPASSGKPRGSPGYGMTSTGVAVTRGIVAVDPSVIPYGTKMFIPGYGFGVAADCGGAVKGNIIDLGYPDGVVPEWTSRSVDIYILG